MPSVVMPGPCVKASPERFGVEKPRFFRSVMISCRKFVWSFNSGFPLRVRALFVERTVIHGQRAALGADHQRFLNI
jgi:hypothetical protein